MTLPELAVATAILLGALVPLGTALTSSSAAFAALSERAHVAARSQVIMDRLVKELMNSRFVSLTPPIPEESHWVRFQKVIDFSEGKPVYGSPIQIELRSSDTDAEDGTDNDGDGLVDEGSLWIWEDLPPYGVSPGVEDAPAVLAANLARDGLKFTRQGAFLLLETTYQVSLGGDAPVTHSLKSGVALRTNG